MWGLVRETSSALTLWRQNVVKVRLNPASCQSLASRPDLGTASSTALVPAGLSEVLAATTATANSSPSESTTPKVLRPVRQSAVHQNYYRRLGIPSGPYRRASPGQARCFERMVKPGLARLDAE